MDGFVALMIRLYIAQFLPINSTHIFDNIPKKEIRRRLRNPPDQGEKLRHKGTIDRRQYPIIDFIYCTSLESLIGTIGS